MPAELEELLRTTAVSPQQPLDARALVRRARHRKAARRAGAGVAGIAAVVAVALSLPGALRPVQQVDLAPGTGGATAAPEDPAATGPSDPPSSSQDVPQVPVSALEGALLLGPEGIRQVREGALREVVGGPIRAAHHLPDGRIVFQALSDEGADIMVTADGVEGTSLVADDDASRVRLHGALVLDGQAHVAFTRREGEGDRAEEWLVVRPVDGGEERRLRSTGGVESGLAALAVAGDRMALVSCHLLCTVELADLTGAPAGPGTLDQPAERIAGAAFVGEQLVLLVLPLGGDAWESAPELRWFDTAAGEEVGRLALPLPTAEWGPGLLAAGEGSVLAVSLAEVAGSPDAGRWTAPLLADVTDGTVRRIEQVGVLVPRR